MKIGILGLGNIGSQFYKEISENYPEIEIKKALVRDISKDRGVDAKLLTQNFDDILNDREIDTVVDATAGPDSIRFIKNALAAGKNAVTANKLAVSEAGAEFIKTARENGVNFYFEACVGGGIPVINLFNENIRFHRVNKVAGILNGTTNYILTRMAEGMEFPGALKLAQEKGFAEPDPTFDLSGRDAAYKVNILKDLLFNAPQKAEDMFCQGIDRIEKIDLEYAKSIGCHIKLIGYIENHDDGLDVGVRPMFLPSSHPLASVKNEFNAIFIDARPIGEIMLFGRGAGQGPTTASLVADVLRIKRNPAGLFNPAYGAENQARPRLPENRKEQCNYFRFRVLDVPGVITKITGLFEKYEISISSMKQEVSHENRPVDVIFTTHTTKTAMIPEMIKKIGEHNFIIGEPIWYRIGL